MIIMIIVPAGAYFITICTQNRRCALSRIVGRGLAPAETNGIEYTAFGKIAESQLLLLEERYPCLMIDRYVIMPNHIHVVLILDHEAAGASPRPTIMDIYQWAIVLKELGEPIGYISVVSKNERLNIVHIGYCIGRNWWHRGFTSEAFKAIIPFFFEEIGVNRI